MGKIFLYATLQITVKDILIKITNKSKLFFVPLAA